MKKDTRYLVSVALMAAIVILLANTPLGMIQLPIIKATTVPVSYTHLDVYKRQVHTYVRVYLCNFVSHGISQIKCSIEISVFDITTVTLEDSV